MIVSGPITLVPPICAVAPLRSSTLLRFNRTMAERFGATTVVDRPPEEVFAFLADGENDKRFSSRIVDIEKRTQGPPGVGTVYASTARDGGVKAEHEFELTEFEPSTKIRWKELSQTTPVVVPVGGYDLAPAGGGGTELTFFNELEARSFLGKLVVGFALRSARKGADDFATAIKRAIEAS
jgi:uncharacterized protein YndB with AHSA1/START domain